MPPTPHNLTLLNNNTGILDLFQTVNAQLLSGMLGALIVATMFIISYLSFQYITNNSGKAFIGASFLSFVLSFLFKTIGIGSDLLMYGCLALAAFSIAFIRQAD